MALGVKIIGGDHAIGDVVRLASGGPWMTVREIRWDGRVQTNWFTEAGELRTDIFETGSLERQH
jgi:uncharacterized protein YodC (DUF2158 family)